MSEMMCTDATNDEHDTTITEDNTALFNVMSQLYCLSIAADFRKPVEVLYPNIASSYLSIIKYPMDLGTLLLHCMKGLASTEYIRRGLRLVFSNSLKFNAGSPMMEAISKHLECFSKGLFEEAKNIPFHDKNHFNGTFESELIRRRCARLKAVMRMPLKESDVRVIEHSFLTLNIIPPSELQEAIKIIMTMMQDFFLKLVDQNLNDVLAPIITLEIIFKPLLEVH